MTHHDVEHLNDKQKPQQYRGRLWICIMPLGTVHQHTIKLHHADSLGKGESKAKKREVELDSSAAEILNLGFAPRNTDSGNTMLKRVPMSISNLMIL